MTQIRRPTRQAKPLASFSLLLLSVAILFACSRDSSSIQLTFVGTWHDQPITCSSDTPSLTDLRFFVSNIELLDAAGKAHPLRIVEPSPWQFEDVTLIDLEDGSGRCDNGSPEMNAVINGTVPVVDFVGIRFTIGVPFKLNHANPLLAATPLDDGAMHWHWRSGYKFMRVGIATAEEGFWLHLGSTDCQGTVQNISGCGAPNRVSVELSNFSPGEDVIALDLSALFAEVDLADGIPSDCSSGPGEMACAAPFAALGVPFGEHVTGKQAVFRVLP